MRIVSGMAFETQIVLARYTRAMIARYEDGGELDASDHDFILELLAGHPFATQKMGHGVRAFTVERDSRFHQTRHLVLHRHDGSTTDFSYLKCIGIGGPRQYALRALRDAVASQILTFRSRAFAGSIGATCAVHGDTIGIRSAHVDHCPPNTFIALALEWMAREGLDLDRIRLAPPRDGEIGLRLEDESVLVSWRQFHAARAELRITCAQANLRAPRKVTA